MFSRKALGQFVVLAALLLTIVPSGAAAQESRGSIVGTITDTTGGVLPGVSVTVANTGTNVSQTVVTDGQGGYRVLYLIPGNYSITVELQGFKKVVRPTNPVTVGDVLRVDFSLGAGDMTETVQVTAETPLLNTNSGVSGTTISAKQIAELPLGDGTAYMLTRLAPGIMDSSDLHFARPADNGNLGGVVANGAQGGNEFTIDGAPNGSNAKGVGFSPPSGAISEFKVQTNAFDAQTGHTAGAVVNLAVKSGTNALHFDGSYFNRDDNRSKTPLLTERANGTKPTRQYNRYTGTVSGPIIHNKTFFMFSFEHLRDVQPEASTVTVPTEKMRTGDLSEFGNQIFDPNTTTSTGARTAFANNLIPQERINPVAAAYAALYPLPNKSGTSGNYFSNMLRPYDYNATMGRADHNFNSANRLFVTTYWNKRREDRYNFAQDAVNATNGGVIGGFAVTKGFDYRWNFGLTTGYTSTLSPTMLLDVKVSGATFGEYRDPAEQFDPAKLGFSSTALKVMNGYDYLPFFTIGAISTTPGNSTIQPLGSQRSDWSNGFDRPMTTYAVAPTLTKIFGPHTGRAGYDFRLQNWHVTNPGYPGGRFQFNGAYTRASATSTTTNDRAQSWAQFLLGLPTATVGPVASPTSSSSQFEITSDGQFQQMYHGLFVQDDWRVNKKLSVNLGLRFEINPGMTEAQDRNTAGFDLVTSNPIEAAAQANYAKNPIPEIPVGSFKVPGGLLFAHGAVNNTATKILPRVAGAYMLDDHTVLRGGVGLFSFDYFFENTNQTGFSQATPVLTSEDNGLTFTGANLTNPIPSGQLIQPVGAALGMQTSLGQSLGTLYQPDRQTPYYTRWEVNLQRDLGHGWVTGFTYIGSHGSDLPVVRSINNVPMQYLSTSPVRDTANDTFLNATFPNPFAGLLAGSTLNGPTIARNQLLRPYPEFSTFSIEEYTGTDRYWGATGQVQKNFRGGSSLTAQYTRSSTHDKLNYLNPADPVLEDRISPNDRPNRFSTGAFCGCRSDTNSDGATAGTGLPKLCWAAGRCPAPISIRRGSR
jgi:hypothetical protein